MTQENKNLLIKDLCARLPYEVKVQYEDGIFILDHISAMYEEVKLNTPNNYTIDVEEVKPYLFPLLSMTEEDIYQIQDVLGEDFEIDKYGITDLIRNRRTSLSYLELDALFDYLDKNHFDYRGLIEKGLAIDATNLNIY